MNKEIQCPDCWDTGTIKSKCNCGGMIGNACQYCNGDWERLMVICKCQKPIPDKEIQEAFEKWWNDDVMKTVYALEYSDNMDKSYAFLGYKSREKEIKDLQNTLRRQDSMINSLRSENEVEINRLREALKGTIYYLRNGELDARRRGTCMMDILETADEILKDGNQ